MRVSPPSHIRRRQRLTLRRRDNWFLRRKPKPPRQPEQRAAEDKPTDS
ncbi:hypothetical protein APED_26965 [Acanthopleuribacter pedis]